jgi:YebC/PmpR family DNA-binding regulatory protein
MSGHSKWSTIKRAKAVTDAKRGAIFTKIGNLITISAREKGGDPEANPSLRMAIDKARSVNMPKDNIERAIKRGTGELGGESVEELYYEAVLPSNVQFIIKCLTDNKNRSASVVRHALAKHNGSLSSVMWNFERKGVIIIKKENIKERSIDIEGLQLELIDFGAEDFKLDDDIVIIFTKKEDLHSVKSVIEGKNIKTESCDIEYIAKEKQEISDDEQDKVDKFIESLEELEDVSDYYNNLY